MRRRADSVLLLVREPLLLLLEPRRVVALERDAAAAVELEDPAGDVVEEVAVVRHGHDRALVVREEALEPEHRLGVEVVRRLVEEEQVGRGEEQPAERDPAALAARERLDVAVSLRQAERVHRVVEPVVELPEVGAVDRVLHLRLLGEERVEVRVGLREGGADLVEAVEQVAQRADAVLDVAAHVLGRIELRLLLEQPDGRARRELGDAGRGLVLAGHDPQQRRLAGAVRAEHADLRSGQERERDVRQHLPVRAVELVGPVHRVDVVAAHRRPTIAGVGSTPWRAAASRGPTSVSSARSRRRLDARRYRKRGLGGTSRDLVELAGDVSGATVLEVGGGVGAIELELLAAGADRATNVELSGEYEEEAAKLLAERGLSERVDRRVGDFVDEPVEPHDVVVMHRVVCCYPDVDRSSAWRRRALGGGCC